MLAAESRLKPMPCGSTIHAYWTPPASLTARFHSGPVRETESAGSGNRVGEDGQACSPVSFSRLIFGARAAGRERQT
jgi:hypothetical protein